MVSVALRLPTAYRSGTGSGKRRKEDGGFKGLGGGKRRGRNESGRKIVVVIRTECCEEIVLNATKLTHAMQKQC